MHHRFWTSLLVVTALLVAAPVARAADEKEKAEAREHYRRGSKAFDLQRFDEAATEYSKVYELIDDPGLLFNIGQALRLGGKYQKAIGSYRSYLHRVPDSTMREQVLVFIEDSKRALEEQRKAAALQQEREQQREQQREQDRLKNERNHDGNPPPIGVAVRTPPPKPRVIDKKELAQGRKLRWIGVGVTAFGVASLAVGGAFAGLTANINNQLNNPKPNPDGTLPSFPKATESKGHTYQGLSAAFFAVGGVAAAAGVATLLVGQKKVNRNTYAFAPLIGPGVVGASYGLEF